RDGRQKRTRRDVASGRAVVASRARARRGTPEIVGRRQRGTAGLGNAVAIGFDPAVRHRGTCHVDRETQASVVVQEIRVLDGGNAAAPVATLEVQTNLTVGGRQVLYGQVGRRTVREDTGARARQIAIRHVHAVDGDVGDVIQADGGPGDRIEARRA